MYKRRLTISLFLPLKRALTQDNDGRLPNIAVHLLLQTAAEMLTNADNIFLFS
jgi:hypothetical protein